jgi:2,3-bisphosphoglycerate-dependent phosphoglycerate mutase
MSQQVFNETSIPRIKRILLVRHGYSMGNHDHTMYAKLGDPLVPLHDEGWKQAIDAGSFLKDYYAKNVTSFENGPSVWASSFLRTRETLGGIFHGAAGALDHCTPIHESPDLVEQDFGLKAYLSPEEMANERRLENEFSKVRRQQYKFYSRLPHGESPFDTYLRMGDVIASMQRDCERQGKDDILIVAHGVTTRAFAMRFLHLPDRAWEHFSNPGNCDIMEIELQEDGSYSLNKIYDGPDGKEVKVNLLADLMQKAPPMCKDTLPKPPKHIR